jgi:hypothetical protein
MLTNCQGQGCGGTRPATSLGRAPRTCDIEDAGGQAVAVWCRDATGTLADSAVGTNVFFPRPGVGTVVFLATGRSHGHSQESKRSNLRSGSASAASVPGATRSIAAST